MHVGIIIFKTLRTNKLYNVYSIIANKKQKEKQKTRLENTQYQSNKK